MKIYSKEEKDKLINQLDKKHKEILDQKLKEIESEFKNKKYQEELEKKLYEKEKENKTEKYKEEIEKKLKELQEKQETTKYQEELEKKLKELETKKDKNCNSDSNCCQEILKSIKNSKENHPMNLECFKETKIWNRKLKEIQDNNHNSSNEEIRNLSFELNELKKQLKEIEQKKDDEINKKIKELEKNIIKNPWIIGEYKWMPIGANMPKGWIKVKIQEGYTLIQGPKNGFSLGKVGKHSHFFADKGRCWRVLTDKNGTAKIFFAHLTSGEVNSNTIVPFFKNYNDSSFPLETNNQGPRISPNEENLAAGMFGELWQYQGIKEENDDKDYICCKKIK